MFMEVSRVLRPGGRHLLERLVGIRVCVRTLRGYRRKLGVMLRPGRFWVMALCALQGFISISLGQPDELDTEEFFSDLAVWLAVKCQVVYRDLRLLYMCGICVCKVEALLHCSWAHTRDNATYGWDVRYKLSYDDYYALSLESRKSSLL